MTPTEESRSARTLLACSMMMRLFSANGGHIHKGCGHVGPRGAARQGSSRSTVATVAALIGGIGAFCGAIVNVLVGYNLAAVASARLSQEAAARFLVTTFSSGFGQAFIAVYFIGIFAAPALMGFALWRSRSVPRWLAVLFFIGLEVAQQQISTGPAVVVPLMLPFAVAMVLLAVRIWQAAALPASLPQLEPARVPV